LPLRVFEVRYLDMVKRCHKAGAPFGVVCLTQGREVASAPATAGGATGTGGGAEAFHHVGTLATIETLDQPQTGLIHISCRGTQRFHIQQASKLRHGLWVADVNLLPDDQITPVPDDLSTTVQSLQQVLHALATQHSDSAGNPVPLPYHWNQAGWVANRWCELLPVDSELKQRLMSLDNPLVRLELVSDVLDKLRLDAGR
jgi:Lon protease-like protein